MYRLSSFIKPLFCAAALAAASLSAQSAGIPGQGTWETTLQARDFNGDGTADAFYDTALNITWMADWNETRGANGAVEGFQHWGAAVAWAAGLNIHGTTGWRLPSVTDTGPPGCDFSTAGGTDCGYNLDTSTGEMAHMFYVTLGNKSLCTPGDAVCAAIDYQAGYGLSNTAHFVDMQPYVYWTGTSYAPDSGEAWVFSNSVGAQSPTPTGTGWYSVAVHDGDVTAVAEPQALAMMLAGLAGVGCLIGRRKR